MRGQSIKNGHQFVKFITAKSSQAATRKFTGKLANQVDKEVKKTGDNKSHSAPSSYL